MDEYLLSLLPEPSRELVRFACTRMQHSYKPVLMRIFIEALPNLTVPMDEVADKFTAFYLDREARCLTVESRHAPFIVAGRGQPPKCRQAARDIVRVVFGVWHG
ncbi:MAG: hypothetical protein N2512_12360 [Armatimonadetes bacterium]|nr:hypothetical protein [Armatimonadota bacterium]